MNLTRFITDHQIVEGARFPIGWGVTWRYADLRAYQLMPIPLNWVAGWLRSAYYRLARGPRDRLTQEILERLMIEHGQGFTLGYKDGEAMAWDHIKRLTAVIRPDIAEHIPDEPEDA